MALNNIGVSVEINRNSVPTNYTVIAIPKFSDNLYQTVQLTLSVEKSIVENSDNAVTFQNIIDNYNAQIEAIINSDFDVTLNTVDIYSEMKTLTNSFVNLSGDSSWLSDVPNIYEATFFVYIKSIAI